MGPRNNSKDWATPYAAGYTPRQETASERQQRRDTQSQIDRKHYAAYGLQLVVKR